MSSKSSYKPTNKSSQKPIDKQQFIDKILNSICINTNQYYKDSSGIHKIENNSKIPTELLDQKHKIFTHADIKPSGSVFDISNLNNFVPLKKIVTTKKSNETILTMNSEPITLKRTEINKFTNKSETNEIILEQVMHWSVEKNEITLKIHSTDASNPYVFISKYKIITDPETGRKIIKLDPYTTEPQKIIKPIIRHTINLRRLNNPNTHGINIYLFLNSFLGQNKINFETRYVDIKPILENINEWKLYISDKQKMTTKLDKLTFDKFKYVESILVDEQTYNSYKSKLNNWRNNYNNWSRKQKTNTLETFDYKFEIKPIGKPKLSRNMEQILEKIQPYDKRIILQKDMETVKTAKNEEEIVSITQAVNFGVYFPYLVSYILRDNIVSVDNHTLTFLQAIELLPLTSENIQEFANFIHTFKSGAFEIISLATYLIDKQPSKDTYIKLTHNPIYVNSDLNKNYTTFSNIIAFKPSVNVSKMITATASKGEPSGSTLPIELPLLKLEEPLFGISDISRIKDFDEIYSNLISNSEATGLFGLSIDTSISNNFVNFYEQKSDSVNDIVPTTDDEDSLFELKDEDFPNITNTDTIIEPKDLGLWADIQSLLIPETEEQQMERKEREAKHIAETKKQQREESALAQLALLNKKEQTYYSDDDYSEEEDYNEDYKDYSIGPEITIKQSVQTIKQSNLKREEKEKLLSAKQQDRKFRETTGKLIQTRDEQELSMQKAAIDKYFDLIINSLEKSREYQKTGLTYDDIDTFVKRAALVKYFSNHTTNDFVKEVLSYTLDDTLSKLEKENKKIFNPYLPPVVRDMKPTKLETDTKTKKDKGKTKGKRDLMSYQEKYLKYKTKYLKLKELLKQ